MVACSGDIVLPGVYLSLRFMRQGCVTVLMQNNNMSRSRFASSFDSCAAITRKDDRTGRRSNVFAAAKIEKERHRFKCGKTGHVARVSSARAAELNGRVKQ